MSKAMFQIRRFLLGVVVASAGALLAPVASAQGVALKQGDPIPGRYIVKFRDGTDAAERDTQERKSRDGGARVHYSYAGVLNGYAASLTDGEVRRLRNLPSVELVEPDRVVSIDATATNATWGLDRIDQRDRPLDTLYNYSGTGAGVYAFIVDTGIRGTHSEFTGRMVTGYTAISDGNGTNDCNGHGTHVAGTVGGTTWGVARQVRLVPVRVLDCTGSGTTSGVIAGVNWVATQTSKRPAVANMSLGGSYSSSLNTAVANAISAGVTFAVAAGNSGANACNYSPSSTASAITVGATDSADNRTSWSNYGACVDLFAPGQSITSAWITSDTATNTISGTSMASPHVAGAAALVLQANPAATPASVWSQLSANATSGRLGSIGTSSPNLLLYTNPVSTPPAANKVVAVKSLTSSATKTWYNWRASVTITIRDVATSAGVAGAAVSASFSNGGSSVSCTTGSTGACTVSTSSLSLGVTSTRLTVTNVSGSGLTYDASQNSATSLTVNKP